MGRIFGDVVDDLDSAKDRFIEGRVVGTPALEDMEQRVPGLADQIGLEATGTPAVEPTGYLEDDDFEAFTEARQESPYLSYQGRKVGNAVQEENIPDEKRPPDPRDVHEDRSEYAQNQDEARDARITTNPRKYASDPNSWDFPGVDTGPRVENTFGTLGASELTKIEESARGERSTGLVDLFPKLD